MRRAFTLFLRLTCNNVSHQSDKGFIKHKLKFYANQAVGGLPYLYFDSLCKLTFQRMGHYRGQDVCHHVQEFGSHIKIFSILFYRVLNVIF